MMPYLPLRRHTIFFPVDESLVIAKDLTGKADPLNWNLFPKEDSRPSALFFSSCFTC